MSFSINLHPDNSLSFKAVITNPLVDPIYVNDATVTVTLYDASGTEVTGQAWPLTLDYIAASNGEYAKSTNPISGLVANEPYRVVLNAVGTDSLEGEWEGLVLATKRGG